MADLSFLALSCALTFASAAEVLWSSNNCWNCAGVLGNKPLVGPTLAADGTSLIFVTSDGFLLAIDPHTGEAQRNVTLSIEHRHDRLDFLYSSPLLSSDGTVVFLPHYQHHRRQDAIFLAFNTRTGQMLWNHTGSGSGVLSRDGQTIYVAEPRPPRAPGFSWPRKLYALDSATGAERWAFEEFPPHHGMVEGFAGDTTSVSPDGAVVFVGSSDMDHKDISYCAISAESGIKMWSVSFPWQGALTPPAVSPDGARIFVGSSLWIPESDWTPTACAIAAIDAKTGKKLWKFTSGFSFWDVYRRGPPRCGPTISPDGQTVYFASSQLYAIDATTGRKRWSHKIRRGLSALGDSMYFTPAVSRDGAKVFAQYDGDLYAFDSKSGKQLWDVHAMETRFNDGTPMVSPDGNVVFYLHGGASQSSGGASLQVVAVSTGSVSAPLVV